MPTFEPATDVDEPPSRDMAEVALLSLRLGATTFGGPAAHIAVLQNEIVQKRQWVDQREFTQMLGLTNLLPGPNSTEMVMHAGYVRAGFRGLLAAGFGFILPGVCLTLLLASAYAEWGQSTAGVQFLVGVQAALIAVLVQAIWRLLSTGDRDPVTLVGIGVVAVLAVLGVAELPLLFGGGSILGLIRIGRRRGFIPALAAPMLFLIPAAASEIAVPYSISRLFLAFLKIGALLYGSGYVLVSLLQGTFVDDLGWLSSQQVLDAVAAGQLTPGPLFTTATFIGYEVGGLSGAVVATIGIFLPAFVFVAVAAPILPRIARQPEALDLLYGVSSAAIGLLAGVTISLARSALDSTMTIGIALLAALALLALRVNSALVIALGGTLALALHVITSSR